MAKKTITVLASDFENNSFENVDRENGCPIQRAFKRTDIDLGPKGFYNCSKYFREQHNTIYEAERKVMRMFDGRLAIEDFSFEIEA